MIELIIWFAIVGVVGAAISVAVKRFPRATPVLVVIGFLFVIGYAAWVLVG